MLHTELLTRKSDFFAPNFLPGSYPHTFSFMSRGRAAVSIVAECNVYVCRMAMGSYVQKADVLHLRKMTCGQDMQDFSGAKTVSKPVKWNPNIFT